MNHFSSLRQQRALYDVILQVELKLSVLHKQIEESRDVARVHLTRVIGNSRCEVEIADDRNAVSDDFLTSLRELAIPSALGGQVDNHRTRRHALDHFRSHEHW